MGKDTELLNNKKLGDLGERIAKIYLEINKYQILKCKIMQSLPIRIIRKIGRLVRKILNKDERKEV